MALVCNCCRACGCLFQARIPLVYCDAHKYIDLQQFSIVADYIRMHPMCNALEVAGNTNVPVAELLRYINEGRLTIVNTHMRVV